jgi:hypothetical protein
MGLCLIAFLGTGILCSNGGDKPPVVVSDFCQIAGPQIAQFSRLNENEIAALTRSRKNAIVTLKRDYKRLCK